MTSDHGRPVDVDRRHRANHSMLTGEVRPRSGSEGRLTRLGHGLPNSAQQGRILALSAAQIRSIFAKRVGLVGHRGVSVSGER
jgi:hypothetical protein